MVVMVGSESELGGTSEHPLVSVQDGEGVVAVREDGPQLGQRILVVSEPWLSLILSGEKKRLVRNVRCNLGFTWLATNGRVYGRVRIDSVERVSAARLYFRPGEFLLPESVAMPSESVFVWSLTEAQAFRVSMPYWRSRGGGGWHVYRILPKD